MTMPVQSDANIEAAMTAFARQPGGGVLAIPDSFTTQHRNLLVALAARNSLPTIYGYFLLPSIGGLMVYTVDGRDFHAPRGRHVDRILKGEKPVR